MTHRIVGPGPAIPLSSVSDISRFKSAITRPQSISRVTESVHDVRRRRLNKVHVSQLCKRSLLNNNFHKKPPPGPTRPPMVIGPLFARLKREKKKKGRIPSIHHHRLDKFVKTKENDHKNVDRKSSVSTVSFVKPPLGGATLVTSG